VNDYKKAEPEVQVIDS